MRAEWMYRNGEAMCHGIAEKLSFSSFVLSACFIEALRKQRMTGVNGSVLSGKKDSCFFLFFFTYTLSISTAQYNTQGAYVSSFSAFFSFPNILHCHKQKT